MEIEGEERGLDLRCEVCYQDLSKKRIVTLPCAHRLHQTCLLECCEFNTTTVNKSSVRCPLCEISLKDTTILDQDGEALPNIIHYGPTGEPSLYFIGTSEATVLHLEGFMINTSRWLLLNSRQFVKAKDAGRSEEFLQDIVDEKKKLLHRSHIIDKLQQQRDELQQRLSDRRAAFSPSAVVNVADEVAVVVVPDAEDIGGDENESDCAICLESLSRKRTICLDKCSHKFHQTCAMKWFEKRRHDHFNPLSCCACRTESAQTTDEDGEEILVSFPFESGVDGLITRGPDIIAFINLHRIRIFKQFEHLATKKRLALRDGKSAEWIADIKEEMRKMSSRADALNNFRATVIENEENDRIVRDNAPAPAPPVVQDDINVVVPQVVAAAQPAEVVVVPARPPPVRRQLVSIVQNARMVNAPTATMRSANLERTRAALAARALQRLNAAASSTVTQPATAATAASDGPSTRTRRRNADESTAVAAPAQPPAAQPALSPVAGPSTRAAARRRREADDESAVAAAAAVAQKRRRR